MRKTPRSISSGSTARRIGAAVGTAFMVERSRWRGPTIVSVRAAAMHSGRAS